VSFAWPLGLLALLSVPIVLGVRFLLRRRAARYAVNFTNLDVLRQVALESSRWRAWVAPILFLLALAMASVAVARPNVMHSVPDERATVVLVLDTSGSMRAEDVQPTRLDAAVAAARAFLDKLPKPIRVALISFSSEPQLVVPPTHDRQLVDSGLGFLLTGGGTAIGDSIARALQVAKNAIGPAAAAEKKPPAAIVLLSDGAQRRGTLQPLEAAELARRARIPVHTVALGTPNGIVEFGGGGFQRTIPVPPDPETLSAVAKATGGTFVAVEDAEELTGVYRSLGSKLGRKREREEVTYLFLGGAAVLLLAAGAASALWPQRLP
jgi:Ca-activated chloride channel family protein